MQLNARIPPPLLAVACSLFMILTQAVAFTVEIPYRDFIAPSLILFAVFIAGSAAWQFKRANTTISPLQLQQARVLVQSGMYRYSRNPMYLGWLFFLIGVTCYLSAPANIVWLIAFCLYVTRFQIVPEEKVLHEIFGDTFLRYCQTTRRWL